MKPYSATAHLPVFPMARWVAIQPMGRASAIWAAVKALVVHEATASSDGIEGKKATSQVP